MIESVESMALLFGDEGVGGNRAKQPGGQRRVDPFEEFQKEDGESIAVGQQAVPARVCDFLDQVFRAQLGQVVAERGESILVG